MSLHHLNESGEATDNTFNFWNDGIEPSAATPDLPEVSIIGPDNNTFQKRHVSVASQSSLSMEEQNRTGEEEQSQLKETFLLPSAPASFVVGPGPRLTSTGKVSHARKVPVNHVKRSVYDFTL